MTLIAGIYRLAINPPYPMTLFGYPHVPRLSTGIHDPLYATALFLSDEKPGVFLISLDLLMLPHEFLNACRDEISQRHNIPRKNILISCTHTHSAPVTMDLLAFSGDHTVPPVDKCYLDLVGDAILSAASEAFHRAVPALAAITIAQVNGVGGNRHELDGPRDPQVNLLVVKEASSSRLMALSLVYSMHPTVLHEDSTLVSADFPGLTRIELEKAYPQLTVIYQTGPSGNQSPRYHVHNQTFTEAERLGNRLANFVIDAVKELSEQDFRDHLELGALNSFIPLPTRIFPDVTDAEANLKQAIGTFEHLKRTGAPHGPTRTAEVAVFGAQEGVVLAKAQESGELARLQQRYQVTEVQVIRLGQAVVVGLAGELFVEYGLELKRRIRDCCNAPAAVISLANGELQGYIVTPQAQGYESSFSLFTPDAGSLLVETGLQLAIELLK